jgi:hypothetical protein
MATVREMIDERYKSPHGLLKLSPYNIQLRYISLHRKHLVVGREFHVRLGGSARGARHSRLDPPPDYT